MGGEREVVHAEFAEAAFGSESAEATALTQGLGVNDDGMVTYSDFIAATLHEFTSGGPR